MGFEPTLGLRDRLVRRVMRHRSVATLFQVASSPPTPSPTTSGSSGAPGEPAETAIAIPVNDVETAGALPQAVAVAPPGVAPPQAAPARAARPSPAPVQRPSQTTAPSREAAPPERPGRAPAPASRPPESTLARRAAVQAAVAAAEAPGAADTGAGASITDTVWRRLQTIFQRHQEPEAQSASEPPAETPPSSHSPDATDREPGSLTSAPARPRISRVPQPHSAETHASSTEGQGRERAARPSREETGKPSPTTEATGHGAATIQRDVTTRPRADMSAPRATITSGERREERGDEEVERTPSGEAGTPPTTAQSQGLSRTVAANRSEATRPSTAPDPRQGPDREEIISDEASRDAATQPLPLQQAWAVEHRPQMPSPMLRRSADVPTVEQATREPTAVELHPAAEDAGRTIERWEPGNTPVVTAAAPESVGRVLEKVAAGAPTRSTIETLAPRRPRPTLTERPATARSRRARTPAADHTVSHTSDVAESNVENEPQTVPAATPADVPADMPANVVETPIGPLPADLWGLIGEPVPHQPVHDQPITRTPFPSAKAPEVPAPPNPTRQVHAQKRAAARGPAVIQRVAAEPQTEDELPQAEEATSPTADVEPSDSQQSEVTERVDREEAPSSPDVDLDELARRVYDEVKHRLALERERSWERERLQRRP